MSVERDAYGAEALLHELALDLRHVPVDGRTQALHVRALQLKRTVSHWRESPVPLAAEERAHVLEELGELCAEARHWQDAPSGRQLAAVLMVARTT